MKVWTPIAGAAALAAAMSMALTAQQPTFKAGTQVVSIFATVTDSQKRLVPSLTQDDFLVFDNEKPQPVVYFDNSIRPINVQVGVLPRVHGKSHRRPAPAYPQACQDTHQCQGLQRLAKRGARDTEGDPHLLFCGQPVAGLEIAGLDHRHDPVGHLFRNGPANQRAAAKLFGGWLSTFSKKVCKCVSSGGRSVAGVAGWCAHDLPVPQRPSR